MPSPFLLADAAALEKQSPIPSQIEKKKEKITSIQIYSK
jgi:hypothetical protein